MGTLSIYLIVVSKSKDLKRFKKYVINNEQNVSIR